MANAAVWQVADTVNFALGAGTHYFLWKVQNFGGPAGGSGGNPAGFLGQIIGDGIANYSSSAWQVSLNDGASWGASTQWAQNGSGIWGGTLTGSISTNAYWLWSDQNFNSSTPEFAWIRTSITVLPEPGTLSLLAIGFAGIAWVRRRKIA